VIASIPLRVSATAELASSIWPISLFSGSKVVVKTPFTGSVMVVGLPVRS
jgi:hypothetical protein